MFPVAARRHLSPGTMVGKNGRTSVASPTGLSLKRPDPLRVLSAHMNSIQPVGPSAVRSIRTSTPPPLLRSTGPRVTSEYCVGGGAMLQTPEQFPIWKGLLLMARPPAFLKPEDPGSGYQGSPSSSGSAAPSKVDDAQVPEETGAAPVDHEAITASVSVGPPVHPSVPVVPPSYRTPSFPVL